MFGSLAPSRVHRDEDVDVAERVSGGDQPVRLGKRSARCIAHELAGLLGPCAATLFFELPDLDGVVVRGANGFGAV